MKDQYLAYQQSLSLQELGFDNPCVSYKDKHNNLFIYNLMSLPDEFIYNCNRDVIKSPTFQQAFEFFEEQFGFYSEVYPDNQQFVVDAKKWYYIIKRGTITTPDQPYNSRKEARSACIDKLIELANK